MLSWPSVRRVSTPPSQLRSPVAPSNPATYTSESRGKSSSALIRSLFFIVLPFVVVGSINATHCGQCCQACQPGTRTPVPSGLAVVLSVDCDPFRTGQVTPEQRVVLVPKREVGEPVIGGVNLDHLQPCRARQG